MPDELISRAAAIDALADYIHNVDKVMGTGHLTADDCKDAAASVFEELPSAQPDCSDCIKHGGDWDCDHVHCHKGESAQPDNDMIHLQKEQAYLQGWEEGRKALRKEIWERWARQIQLADRRRLMN